MKIYPNKSSRSGMTLVEIMVSLMVFSVAILGTVSVFILSLRTVEDSRSFTQVTQIINHEMEAMRTREWDDRPVVTPSGTVTVHGLHSLCTGVRHDINDTPGAAFTPPGGAWVTTPPQFLVVGATQATSTFKPFAVYGVFFPTANDVAVLAGGRTGDINLGDPNLQAQYRNASGIASGFTCRRTVTLVPTGATNCANYVNVTIQVSWTDRAGKSHSRDMKSTMSQDGLNKVVYDASKP